MWRHLPLWALLPVQLAFLAAIATALWRSLHRLRMPGREEGIRRLEQANGLAHHPISAYEDEAARLSGAAADPHTRILWQTHKRRLKQQLAGLRFAWPRSFLPRRDPYALRVPIILGLVVSLVAARSDYARTFAWITHPTAPFAEDVPVTLDAWINPPAYTGLAPIFLTRQEVAASTPLALDVPHGSTFMARVQGVRRPPSLRRRLLAAADQDPPAESRFDAESRFEEVEDGVYEQALTIEADAELTVMAAGRALGSWTFDVRQDQKPVIGFTDDVTTTKQLAIKIPYVVLDDYGVVSAWAVFTLAAAPLEPTPAPPPPAAASDAVAALRLELPLPQLRTKSARETLFKDLTAHPWAGLEVQLHLEAEDEAGQIGRSEIVTLTLPERIFTHPLARAVIEQRKFLAMHPDDSARVRRFLDAFSRAPENYFRDLSVYLGLRAAYWRLAQTDPESRARASQILWDLAVSLEDGGLLLAARRLRELQQQLSDAIADGKPQDEIDRLMQALREALDNYLQALIAQGLQDLQNGQMPPGAQNGLATSAEDWQQMLDAIEQMLRDGNMEGARQLLSQLMTMLENLQVTLGGQGMGPGESAMNEALGKLGDMIGRQRGLLDETFRQAQPGAPETEQGAEGQPPENRTRSPGELADEQNALEQELSELLQGLRDQGVEVPGALDRAGRTMDRSAEALENGDLPGAVERQKDVIDQLRQGAQSMAQTLLDQMAARAGLDGESLEPNGEFDPLGRPSSAAGPEFGDSVQIPEQRDLQRARTILRELRRRASERGRPTLELDYLERLLKRF